MNLDIYKSSRINEIVKYLIRWGIADAEALSKGVDSGIQEVYYTLAILCHKNFVIFEQVGTKLYYRLNREEIERVQYYGMYQEYIGNNFSVSKGVFEDALVNGFVGSKKESAEIALLKQAGIFVEKQPQLKDINGPKRSRRNTCYYTIDSRILDRLMICTEFGEYLSQRYHPTVREAYEVLQNTIHVGIVDKVNFIKEHKDIKIKKGVEWLAALNIVDEKYNFTNDERILLQNSAMRTVLSDTASNRMYQIIKNKVFISDKDITVNSLLPIPHQKNTLFSLQSKGFISLKCIQLYKLYNKVEHEYFIDQEYTRNNVLKLLKSNGWVRLHFLFRRKS
ncbi:hypothetical protein ECANGB1_1649 [Enterospora canceri]|uniref:Uncharacterized protein n=1 Tax=Enterospora canceri TaxID=1081671 RepID=A0A1Y1S937_9MICR|nr:hypothetical protein ECANGB1_1649 [Enterospora canceri]